MTCPSRTHDVTPVIRGINVGRRFSFLCCVFCLVCFHTVSCVTKVTSFSGLSILDCPFGFL